MEATTETPHSSEQALDATQESLEKVREASSSRAPALRQQDHRSQAFEQKLAKELSEFGEESRKRLDALESFVKREIGSILDLLKAESSQRTDAHHALAQQLHDSAAGISKRIAAVDEQHGNSARELRGELLGQSKTLRDDLSTLGQSLTAQVEKTCADLRHGKTDRAALAGLFSEMAQRLGT